MDSHPELAAALPEAVIVVDRAGVVRFASPGVAARLGYEPAELVGREVDMLVPQPYRGAHASHRARFGLVAGPMRNGVVEAQRKDGTTVPVEIHIAPLARGDDTLFCATIRDARPPATTPGPRNLAQDRLDALSDGLVVFGPGPGPVGLEVVDVSARFCELTGFTRDELVGSPAPFPWWGRDPAEHAHFAALLGEPSGDFEDVLHRRDGSTFPALVSVTRLPHGGGPVALVKDMTAHRSLVAHLREQAAIVAAAHDAIIVRGLDGRVLEWNPAAIELYGRGRGEAVGQRLDDLLQTRYFAPPETIDRALAESGRWRGHLRQRAGDGRELVVASRMTLLRDDLGRPRAVLELNADISARSKALEDLAASEARFRTLATQAPVGFFETDADGATVWVNESWSRITAADPAAGWAGRIDPDDADEVAEAWREAADRGGPFQARFRIVRGDGARAWIDATAAPIQDPQGNTTGHIGTLSDVTPMMHALAAEEAQREIATVAVQGAPLSAVLALVAHKLRAVFGVDTVSVVRFDGPHRGVELAASPDDERVGAPLVLEPGTALARVAVTGQPAHSVADRSPESAPTSDRSARTGSAVPIKIGGRVWGALAMAGTDPALVGLSATSRLARFAELASNAIANAEARDELVRLAATDSLTGLANRRTFDQTLRGEMARAFRRDRALCVVLLDLDDMKRVNDTAGHQAGDELLVTVARRLHDNARRGELVARLGGDEFGWILPEESLPGAIRAATRALAVIHAEPIGEAGHVTGSAGVAAFFGLDFDDLLGRADAALYRAKAVGGNRVCADGIDDGDDGVADALPIETPHAPEAPLPDEPEL